jgi:hypothetical protein
MPCVSLDLASVRHTRSTETQIIKMAELGKRVHCVATELPPCSLVLLLIYAFIATLTFTSLYIHPVQLTNSMELSTTREATRYYATR